MSYIDTKAKRQRIQAALIAAGYDCGPDRDDGDLGTDSAKAILKFRTDHGLLNQPDAPAVVDTDLMRELGLLTIQDPAIASAGSIQAIFVQMAIKAFLPQLLKGLPTMSNVLAGQKTIILGVVTMVVGALALIGWDIPGFNHVPGGLTIDAGLGMIFLRLGIKNAVTDLIEKVISGIGK